MVKKRSWVDNDGMFIEYYDSYINRSVGHSACWDRQNLRDNPITEEDIKKIDDYLRGRSLCLMDEEDMILYGKDDKFFESHAAQIEEAVNGMLMVSELGDRLQDLGCVFLKNFDDKYIELFHGITIVA